MPPQIPYRPHGPRSNASADKSNARSRATCISHWQAARVAASAPALAPEHGTRLRSTRFDRPTIAPACHQKKMPPPGKARPRGRLAVTVLITIKSLVVTHRHSRIRDNLCVAAQTTGTVHGERQSDERDYRYLWLSFCARLEKNRLCLYMHDRSA